MQLQISGKQMKRSAWLGCGFGLVLLGGSLAYAAFAPPQGPRSLRQFDADRLADLEVGMWQAYYGKERVRLFGLLVTMLHEQYHYSWATAARQGFYLARAAANFGDARGNYEPLVLPDLELAYATAKDWLGAGFDPPAVACAELAWWIARRVPGQNSPEQVGALMARAYGLLYEAPESTMTSAATLRAQAARLHDLQEKQPAWPTIRDMLRRSYGELHAAVSSGPAR
jgi:hypothetical protein